MADNAVALQLTNASKNAQNALDELRVAADKVKLIFYGSTVTDRESYRWQKNELSFHKQENLAIHS